MTAYDLLLRQVGVVLYSADRRGACNTTPALTTQPVKEAGMAAHTLTDLERFESKYIPEPNSGCWIWLGYLNPAGYGQFTLYKEPMPQLAHRAAWFLLNGPFQRELCVCHRCDVRCCVNPDHLFLGTMAENMADMARKGRSGRAMARLTVKDVLAIRLSTEPDAALAARYAVVPHTIYSIKRRLRWSHVQ